MKEDPATTTAALHSKSATAVAVSQSDQAVLDVAVFSFEAPGAAVAMIRLSGILGHLQKQGRLRLHWHVANEASFNLEEALDSDIFVIHRQMAERRFCASILAAARALAKPVVFELDDLLINIPSFNPHHAACQAIIPDLLALLAEADIVTVTTEPLRGYLEAAEPRAKGKIHVLPNYLDLDLWDGATLKPQAGEPFVVGWVGSPTHDADLAILKPVIAQLARKYAGRLVFKFWGYLPKELAGLPGVQLVRGYQSSLREHARGMVNSHIDLALAPLANHPFNHAKSDIKWLEYSICYVPGIYSAISPYVASVEHGRTGWLVHNQPEAWRDAIETLMADHALRRSIAQAAHDRVRSSRCITAGAAGWEALYRSLAASTQRSCSEAERVESRNRAAAHFLAHQATAASLRGQTEQAVGLYDEAILRYGAHDAAFGELVRAAQSQSRNLLKSAETTAQLRAARAVASAGVNEPATRLYLEAVQTATKAGNPATVLRTVLEAARALRALDPEQGRKLLDLGTRLSTSLRCSEGLEAIERLRTDYQQKPSESKLASPVPQQPAKPECVASAAPTVSVVIPVYNKLALTRACLESLGAVREKTAFEIVLVDNGSTDDTGRFTREQQQAGRLRLITNARNEGFARACNQGARAARGKYVLFLNNDTEVQPGWLSALVARAEGDPAVVAVGSKLLFPDGTIQHAGVALAEATGRDPLLATHTFYRMAADTPEANRPRIYQALTAACLLVRRSAFEAVGGFDEGFWNGYEDVDLCLRLQERGGLLVYEPASVVVHHESQSGPARFEKAQENIRHLHQKWLGKAQVDVILSAEGKLLPAQTARIRPYVAPAAAEPLTSILILAHNQLEHTRRCLASIEQHTPQRHEIILVDNASTDGTAEWLTQYAANHPQVKVIRNAANRGFAAGNNQALALAKGDFVLLLNNDTVVTQGWLEHMLAVCQQHPATGIVGPRSNRVVGPQWVEQPGYRSLAELPGFATEWTRQHSGQSTLTSRVIGFCLLARRAVLDALGGLDEQFGSGNFEDDDYCLRACFAGFEVRIAHASFVHHVGGQTFQAARLDYRQAMLTNWRLFKQKWQMSADAPIEKGYRAPVVLPPGVALKAPLPDLARTHEVSADGRCWKDRQRTRKIVETAKLPTPVKTVALPPCALMGNLAKARELLGRKQYGEAWTATLAAIAARPFHPEAYLFLAELARLAGDSASARRCAQYARELAPGWKPARKFLQSKLSGNAKPTWLALPDTLPATHASRITHHAPRLSVCLITRNEEKFLGQCLASVRALADQIVVVDTGSTDRTVEIAKEHRAEVYHFAWCDDFSAARNAALEHATGDWILMLDADEELPASSHEPLRRLLREASVMAWRLPIIDVGREDEGCSYVPRLFRNAPTLFYVGRVHEQVFSSLEARRQEWGLDNRLGDAPLRHHGYRPEVVKDRNKIERNLRLLEQAVQELPGDPNLLMNYGLELTRSGQAEAGLAQYRQAFEVISAQPASRIAPEMREMLLAQFCTQLMAQKHFEEIVRVLTSPLTKASGLTASLHFSLGLAYMEQQQFAEAAAEMRQCLAKRGQPSLSPINKEIRKVGPRHCLALCLERAGQAEAAAQAFREAIQEAPDSRPVRLDFARFLAAHQQPVEALNLLFALTTEQPSDTAVWLCGGEIALSRPEFLEVALDWTAQAHAHAPQVPAIVQQRAEALTLAGQCEAALPLWRQLPAAENPAVAGPLVLCETVRDENRFHPLPQFEVLASREFLKWYKRLLEFRQRPAIEALNKRAEVLEAVLPSAGRLIAAVAAETAPAASTTNRITPACALESAG